MLFLGVNVGGNLLGFLLKYLHLKSTRLHGNVPLSLCISMRFVAWSHQTSLVEQVGWKYWDLSRCKGDV